MQPLTASQRRMLEAAVSQYQEAVSAELAGYLLDRGVEESTARTARLGEVRDPFPGHERYVGWLCIPYLDKDGAPVTVRFRRPDWLGVTKANKYASLPDDPPRMYGVPVIHRAVANHEEVIHMTEGELDALILNQEGFSAVAVPGAQSFKRRWGIMLAGFSKVLVWADGDEAGGQMVAKVTKAMRQATPIVVPKGQDVTDVYLSGGREALLELVRKWGNDEQED